ncbi:MAG: VWA domain-containing protein [Planctomycetaceae bacterium]
MSVPRPFYVALFLVWLIVTGRSATAADRPLAEEAIISLVELEIDDEAIIARIKKAGLAFAPDDAALGRLTEAGASEAVIEALRKAGAAKKPAADGKAITFPDIMKLLELEIDETTILKRLEKSPTVFVLDAEQITQLKDAGASDTLIGALQRERPISAQAAELITDFAVILDCSGSMKEITKEGETKMAVAQRVITDLIEKIPDGLEVTFIIYGHEVFGDANDPRNCKAVKIVRPLSPLDMKGKGELSRLIAGLKPTGATPIALSLKTAGAELAKHDTFCGLVLITDGKETCQGDPVGEAAQLVKDLKITFGVNVVGFDVGKDRAGLEEIAEAGNGHYFNADSAEELADALGKLSEDLEKVATPPKKEVSNRRAIKVLKPDVEFPPYVEIRVVSRGLGSVSVAAKGKYGEEIRIPSSTEKYEIQWVPKTGLPVAMLKEFTLSERKVIEIKPEEHLGMIQVNGKGTPKEEIMVYQRGLGSIHRLQECKKYGEIMVVPAEKVNVRVDGEDIEEGLEVEAGTLHELE